MRGSKIAILVLNWNGKGHTLECLSSLEKVSSIDLCSTLVIDNGSTDDSVEAIRKAFPQIPILELDENLGYAGGCNAGIRWALGKSFEWILLLNNDAIAEPDFIDAFLAASRQKPSAAILGAKAYSRSRLGQIDSFGGYWNPASAQFEDPARGKTDEPAFEQMQIADYVCGCALFMRREVPETIGLLDERFFLFWEEADFCTRARRHGFEIWTAPQAKVHHKVSASFTGGKPHTDYFWWRNRLLWISSNCAAREKRRLYREVLLPEMAKSFKLAFLKTAQVFLLKLFRRPIGDLRAVKARRYRAASCGILHYFLGRFGNCPARYAKPY